MQTCWVSIITHFSWFVDNQGVSFFLFISSIVFLLTVKLHAFFPMKRFISFMYCTNLTEVYLLQRCLCTFFVSCVNFGDLWYRQKLSQPLKLHQLQLLVAIMSVMNDQLSLRKQNPLRCLPIFLTIRERKGKVMVRMPKHPPPLLAS